MGIFDRRKPETTVDPKTGTVVTTPPGRAVGAQSVGAPSVGAQSVGAQVQASVEKARREGYQSGRKDGIAQAQAQSKAERRRRSHPLIAAMVVLIALAGALGVALAVHEGSFTDAGRVVDAKVAAATEPARDAVHDAADRSGAAVANAGQAIQQQGQKLRQSVE